MKLSLALMTLSMVLLIVQAKPEPKAIPIPGTNAGMCTGDYQESGMPPTGTKCVEKNNKVCHLQSGRWGKSWCYTDGGGWGAECVNCSAALCKGTNGEPYTAGEGYTIGCFQYICGDNGKLNVDIDPICCLHQGRYYEVGEVVAEIPYGKDCVLEHNVCKDSGLVVKEPVVGKCNCEHNGEIVKEGENVTLSTGNKASCCSGAMVTPVKKTSTHMDFKLVGGMKPGMGNVYLNDVPVGDCTWDKQAATVICQELGFGDAIETPKMTKKSSSKDVPLKNFSIKCNGDEESFNDCKITDECNSGVAASVRCRRVKIEDNGQVFLDAKPLCVDGLQDMEATALCRELGFSTGMLKPSGSKITTSSSKNISCSGFLLSDCNTSECNKDSPMAALVCSNKMDIELMGGNGENEGNVYYKGGPVCDDDFDMTDANVVCQELEFERAEKVLTKSPFGLVTLPFTLDNLNCKGDESKLSECEAVKESNCGEEEGVGVVCMMKTHSRSKRGAAAVLTALPGVLDSGSKIVGGIMNYFAEKEKRHQAYLKERPEKVDLSNDKLSIKMKPQKGYLDPSGEFNPGGYQVDIGTEAPPQKESKDGGPAFTYSNGIGPMLMNGCFGSNYAVGDPCYASKRMSTKCLDMIESANYVGVGFDGTGEYTHASRKKSLIQRTCAAKRTYHTGDVPDSMNIFGIYDTACSGSTFNSLDARSEFQRDQSDMGSNEDLLRYKGGSNTKIKAKLGFGKASLSASHSSYGEKESKSRNSRHSRGSAESKAETTKTNIYEFTCTIRRYNIFLDEVTPTMLSSAFLEDYMSLPIRYYDFRQQAPLRYSRFLQRWGTHYIKSASFGGKFTLLRESRMHAEETKTEWQERVQEDTSQMFESKHSSWDASGKYSVWSASAELTVDTANTQNSDSSATSTTNENQNNSKNKEATSYSMDDIIVEGGDQKVASILADKHRAGFKAEFTDWLESIPVYPKGYDFMFGELTELLNMNYRSLLNKEFEPCWKFNNRYNLIDDDGEVVCSNCLYNTTVKNEEGDEVVEVRKCQFQDLNDFQDNMDRKLLSLKRGIDIFIKNGGKSTTEMSIPGGINKCENHDKAYNEISYKDLLSGKTYRVDFDLREDIGDEIGKTEAMYISFKHGKYDDSGEVKKGRWAVDDSATSTFAGQYSQKIEVDMASEEVILRGVQFSYESDISGHYLMMNEEDCGKNKERITSMAHQECNSTKDLYWLNVPLATVHPMKIPNTFYPCNLEWSNANMLMSESSCVRFTATSKGPIYFALAAIPDRSDSMYYLRISPTDVTIYKKSVLLDSKTNKLSAVGLGHKDIFQSYIICSEHKKESNSLSQNRYTRITYGKLAADETINKDTTLNAYLIMEDDDAPIEPTYFAFGSGEDKVQIVDLELLDMPVATNIECRGDTIEDNGQCVQACKKSKIAEMSKQTVQIKCYKEETDDEYDVSVSHVQKGSYCEAICPDGEVSYPSRTVCSGDSTWTDELNCHKECEKTDNTITKGLFVVNGKKESKNLTDTNIDCPNQKDFAGLIIKGVKCNVSCGMDDAGLKYHPIGDLECSRDSKWHVNSMKDQNVCKSIPCLAIKHISNGIVQCSENATDIQAGSYVSEGTECTLLSCNDKYKREEPYTLTCSDGKWRHLENVESLQCIPTDKTCPATIPPIPHGTVSCEDKDKSDDGNYFGATICPVSCDAKDGYGLEVASNSIIQCVNGDWEVKASCIDNTCPANLAKVDHGTVSCNANDKDDSRSSYYSGTACSVSCLKGYGLEDASKSTIQCVNRVWKKAICIDNTCPANLPKVDHGTVSCNANDKDDSRSSYFSGTTCSVSCLKEYELEDASNSIIQCVNGDWEVKATCIDKTCPANLAKVDRGTVSCNANDKVDSRSSYYSGTTCSVSCQNGAKSSIQCASGDWEVKAVCVDSYVLWLAPAGGTLNIPDMSLVNRNCEITSPNDGNAAYSQTKKINGKLYWCNHEKCQIYDEEAKSWTILNGMKFNNKRGNAAGTIIGNNQWLVTGGVAVVNGKWTDVDTAEIWSSGQGNWQFSTTYKSPLPVWGHCLVNTQGGVMQIGGFSHALDANTNRCFLNQKEVQGLKKGRNRHACILHSGQIFVAGGVMDGGSDTDVEVYNIQTGQWSDGPRLPMTQWDTSPQLVEIDKKLHYIGGYFHGKIYRLDDGTNSWNYVTNVRGGLKYFAAIMKKSCK